MTVKTLAILTALLLAFGLVFAAPAAALHAVQDEGEGTISLDAVSPDVPEQASGLVTFDLRTSSEGFYLVKARVRVNALPEKAGRVYEAWLIDDDTNHNLSLGVFDTDNDGDGSLRVERSFNNLALYDRIVVTSENTDDIDPGSEGEVVLEGKQE